jgi:hypothetical protein
MTPEEHIERAEWLLAINLDPEYDGSNAVVQNRLATAQVHVSIAFFKKQYPPEIGRPLRSSGRMHNHAYYDLCSVVCPAHDTDSTNYPRPISDNPQA